MLETLPLDVHPCPDVYRGLARLCSTRSPTPRAVLVCMDATGAPELEFFSILSRLQRDLPLYVYGHERSKPRMGRAIELGAVGEVTESLLRALAIAPVPSPEPVADDRTDAREEPDSTLVVTPPIPLKPSATLEVSTPPKQDSFMQGADQDRARDESQAAPVRVPWLRYENAPAREAPSPKNEPVHRAPPDEPDDAPASSYQPLLTEEELRALIGNDLAAPGDDQQSSREESP